MKTRLGVATFGFLCSVPILAQNVDVPISNWTVPPYTRTASPGLAPMNDVTLPIVFVGVAPCRILDTRQPGQGPPLDPSQVRVVDLRAGPCTGFPTLVEAWSLNFGGILPPADGFLTAWAFSAPQPSVSQLNLLAGEVVANAAIIPTSGDDRINVLTNVGPTHLYIDVNGYFATYINSGEALVLHGDNPGPVIRATNSLFGTGQAAIGVQAEVAYEHSNPVSAGVVGTNSGNGQGVRGLSVKGYGVQGISLTPFNSAGVQGEILFPAIPNAGFARAGVRGMDTSGFGVLGVSEANAVTGHLVSSGLILASGALGTNFGSDPDGGGPPWGVHATGNIGATGVKAFLEPHPTDPTRVIQYIALEGPEAGTYFRGRARLQRGLASIPVPEDFRMVTDPEGLTVQITPIGEMASFAVVRMGLDGIVVKASRDVEFSYLVQGVRASFKDAQPIIRDGTFIPQSPEARMPAALSERQKRILIANGTYNEDGSVNRETARRRGWDEVWKRRHAPPSQAAPPGP